MREFSQAARDGKIKLVRLYLDKDIVSDVNMKDINKALCNACIGGHLNIVELLLDYGADIDYNNGFYNPLSDAVLYNHNDIVELLLSYGANTEIVDDVFGSTPLYLSVQNGNMEMVKLLLLNGAKVNTLTNNGSSILHSAAFGIKQCNNKCYCLIEWLLTNYEDDLDPFLKNKNGIEPRDILNSIDWSYAELYDDILEKLGYYIIDLSPEK